MMDWLQSAQTVVGGYRSGVPWMGMMEQSEVPSLGSLGRHPYQSHPGHQGGRGCGRIPDGIIVGIQSAILVVDDRLRITDGKQIAILRDVPILIVVLEHVQAN